MTIRWIVRAANDRSAQVAQESSPVIRSKKDAYLRSRTVKESFKTVLTQDLQQLRQLSRDE